MHSSHTASLADTNIMLDSKKNLPKNPYRLSNLSKPSTYDPYNDTKNFGFRALQTAQNYANYKASDGNGLKTREDHENNDPAEESPPTWRAREIEKGRVELMEKLKSMPESCFELSLKDIVEKPVEHQGSPTKEQKSLHRESVPVRDKNTKRQGSNGGSFKRRSDARAQMMMRNGSIGNGGLLLKMVFPVSLGSPNSIHNTSKLSTGGSAKVSPRPSYSDEPEKEWCRKTFSPFTENGKLSAAGNARKTESSRSNKDKNVSRQGIGCWPFFWTKRSKLKSKEELYTKTV